MPILFTGRKADLTPALREFAAEKLGKLARFAGDDPDAHVILTREKHRHVAEVVAHSRIGTLTARADAGDIEDALRACLSRVLAQAKKHRALRAREPKRRAMKASPRARGARRGAGVMMEGDGAPPGDDDGTIVVPMGRVPVKPMSIEEAVLEMQASPESFLVFRDADTRRVAVLVRRADGRFGLIEPEA